MTPPEVQTSAIKWRASASSAIERALRALRSIDTASAPFKAELTSDKVMPQPSASSACGESQRATAVQMIASPATTISTPSKPLEKYSALWWPQGWSSSGGFSASVTISSAKVAPARLTSDSSAIVATATAIDSWR